MKANYEINSATAATPYTITQETVYFTALSRANSISTLVEIIGMNILMCLISTWLDFTGQPLFY